MNRVPKLLWHTWKHPYPAPPLRRCMQSFEKLNPDWEIRLVTDEGIRELIDQHFPELKEHISKFPGGVYLADIWRCLVLFKYGGIYSDIDVECIQPLDDLLEAIAQGGFDREDASLFICRDHPVHEAYHYAGRPMHMNFFMIAKPGAKFFQKYIERLVRLASLAEEPLKGGPVDLTGPGAFSEIIEETGSPEALGISVIPWEWISPLPNMAIRGDFEKKEDYHALIRGGDWSWELWPFVAHYWWHNYSGSNSILTMYGDELFQRDEMFVNRRLETLIPEDAGEAAFVEGRAIAEVAATKGRRIVELGRESDAFAVLLSEAFGPLPCEYIDSISGTQRHSVDLLKMSLKREDDPAMIEEFLRGEFIRPGGLILLSAAGCPPHLAHAAQQALAVAGYEMLEAGPVFLARAPSPAARVTIPKIIHRTWKTGDIPPVFKSEWIASWMAENADQGWQEQFWTDESLMEFVAEYYPDFAPCYYEYDHPKKRVDAARYLVLKTFGGVFVDMDFACLKPLEELLAGRTLLLGTEHGTFHQQLDRVSNAFIASVPGHSFWKGIEKDLKELAHREVMFATGSYFLSQRLRKSSGFLDQAELPEVALSHVLYPVKWNDPGRDQARAASLSDLKNTYPDSFAITFWSATWLPE